MKGRRGFWQAAAAAVLLACVSAAARAQAPQAPPHVHWHSKPEAVAALRLLREGGNVIFFRHAKTDMLTRDGDAGEWNDCTWQRNLSPMGREASHEMGSAFRLLGIVVGDVWSSPYCRCMDTAVRAFGKATPVAALAPRAGGGMRLPGQALRELASRPLPAGTNTVIVAHIFNALGAFGETPEEGEAFVIRTGNGGEPRIAARVTMTQWGDLVRDLLVFGLDPGRDDRATGHRHGGAAGQHGR